MRHFVLSTTGASAMPNRRPCEIKDLAGATRGRGMEKFSRLGKNDLLACKFGGGHVERTVQDTCPGRVAEQVKVCVILGLVVGHNGKAN